MRKIRRYCHRKTEKVEEIYHNVMFYLCHVPIAVAYCQYAYIFSPKISQAIITILITCFFSLFSFDFFHFTQKSRKTLTEKIVLILIYSVRQWGFGMISSYLASQSVMAYDRWTLNTVYARGISRSYHFKYSKISDITSRILMTFHPSQYQLGFSACKCPKYLQNPQKSGLNFRYLSES